MPRKANTSRKKRVFRGSVAADQDIYNYLPEDQVNQTLNLGMPDFDVDDETAIERYGQQNVYTNPSQGKIALQFKLSLFLGPPMRGKSHVARYEVTKDFLKGRTNVILIFVANPETKDWSWADQRYVHSNVKTFVLALWKLMQLQMYYMHYLGYEKAPIIDVVIDDPLGSIEFNHALFRKICSSFRHFKLRVRILCQYMPCLPFWMYVFATEAFIFRLDVARDAVHLWERWLQSIPTADFMQNPNGVIAFQKKFMQDYNPYTKQKQHLYLHIVRNAIPEKQMRLCEAPPEEVFNFYTVDCSKTKKRTYDTTGKNQEFIKEKKQKTLNSKTIHEIDPEPPLPYKNLLRQNAKSGRKKNETQEEEIQGLY